MKRVAQSSGMSKIDIEEHEFNHHNDVKEQTYALLEAWYQRQGLHGAYPTLINTLHRMKERRTADKIQDIIEPIAQPLTEWELWSKNAQHSIITTFFTLDIHIVTTMNYEQI